MSGFKAVRLDEIEEVDDGRCPFRPIRHHLGITAFGINAWTARDAGDRIINEHEEGEGDNQEELYLVLRGHAAFEVGEEKVDAPEGMLVFVPPSTRRTAFAEEAGTTVLAIGAARGEAYEVAGWELWAPAQPAFQAGDYERAVEIVRPIAEQNEHYPALLYNLACAESLAGHTADALEHLRVVVGRYPRARELARGDSDFDPIRDEHGFRELVGEESVPD